MMHRAFWNFAFGLACASLSCQIAIGQSDHNIVYVENFAEGKDDASPYPPGHWFNPWVGIEDNTGGIEKAIDSCRLLHEGGVDLWTWQGCKIVLPRGYVEITETIDVNWNEGLGETDPQYGLVVRGHGSGLKDAAAALSYAGTTLVWRGVGNETVLRIKDTSFSSFEDFIVDGDGDTDGGAAGIGIEVTSKAVNGSAKFVTLRHVAIESVRGTPGIGLEVGSAAQVSELEFDTLFIRGVNVGVHQWGAQTGDATYRKIEMTDFRDYGMDFEAGPVDVHDCVFMNIESLSDMTLITAIADVRVRAMPLDTNGGGPMACWVLFEGNYHETQSGSAYLFHNVLEDPQYRRWPTTILNTRVNWFRNEGNIIDYRHPAPLNLIGCSFDLPLADCGGKIYVESPVGQKLTATTVGNFYDKRFNKVRVATRGDVTLVSDDSGFVDSEEVALDETGLFLVKGSLNFTTVDDEGSAAIPYRLDYDATSSNLALRGADGAPISTWSDDGTLSLDAPSPRLSFGSTTVVPVNPSATAEIKLPDVSGTVLLDSTAPPICGIVGINPGSISKATSQDFTVSFSGLSGDEVCTCVPLTDWNDDVLQKYCYAGAGTISVRLYNADTRNSKDPPLTSVRVCCAQP